jgi:oligoribonuclease NrnB/cAMP/cGMP phosphodiesterase (DHH superfamily)
MDTTKTILYHNDADGFGAAYAAWKMFEDSACYIPVQYNQPIPEIPKGTKELYIVDFSYSREVCIALRKKYPVLIIIDHHKTAQEDLRALPYATFDMNKSGAVLTWEFFTFEPVPEILLYVQDRDLWKFELPKSKEINAYIATLPWEFNVWNSFNIHTALSIGDAIVSFQKRQIESRLKDVTMINFGYGLVPMVNATENISELGEAMCFKYPETPFSVSYADRADGKRTYSLRSKNGFDVSVVAKRYGGGGHSAAAGFVVEGLENRL